MEDDSGTGWRSDPTGRHQFRYHDGTTFTTYVSDDGIVSVDGDEAAPSTVTAGTSPAVPGPSGPVATWPPPPQQPSWPSGTSPYGGPYRPDMAGPPPTKKRRVGLFIVIGVAVLEGIAIIALSVALVAAKSTTSQPTGSTVSSSGSFTQSEGHIVYSSNFGSGQGWATGSLDANTTASVTNGQYVVDGDGMIHHPLLTPYTVAHPAISVEAGVTDFSSNQVSVGVGCQSGSGVQPPLVYQLVVYPNGQWYIEEARSPGGVKTLASGYGAPLETTDMMQLTCAITSTTSNKETAQLVAYVNGRRVGAIGDQIARPFVGGYIPLLVFGSYGPKVHLTYTGMTVRSFNP
jgi:hypothetical protein